MKIGILGTADIAFRRFLPALGKYPAITYAGKITKRRNSSFFLIGKLCSFKEITPVNLQLTELPKDLSLLL